MPRGRTRASSSCSNASDHDKGERTQPLEWFVSRLGRPYREPVFRVGVSSMIAVPFECTGRLGRSENAKNTGTVAYSGPAPTTTSEVP